jgi:hypothetical protein
MGSFIIKAIQAFSKTERAQRLKAAIKAYRDHECLTTEPEQTPKAEEPQPTPEETEAFFDNLDFAMLDQGGSRLSCKMA